MAPRIRLFAHLFNGLRDPLNIDIQLTRVPSVGEYIHLSLSDANLLALVDADDRGSTRAFIVTAVDHLDVDLSHQFDAELWAQYITTQEHGRRVNEQMKARRDA